MATKIRRGILVGCTTLITGLVLWSAQANAPNTLLAQGDPQWAAGQLDQAQESFEHEFIDDTTSVSAHMIIGGLQFSRQEFKACIATYQRVIGLDADNARAWLGLGFAYLHTGQSPLSVAAFNEAVRVDPSNQEKLAPVLAKLMTKAKSDD